MARVLLWRSICGSAPVSGPVGVGTPVGLRRGCLDLPCAGWAWGPCGVSRHPASPRGAHQVGVGDQGLWPVRAAQMGVGWHGALVLSRCPPSTPTSRALVPSGPCPAVVMWVLASPRADHRGGGCSVADPWGGVRATEQACAPPPPAPLPRPPGAVTLVSSLARPGHLFSRAARLRPTLCLHSFGQAEQ